MGETIFRELMEPAEVADLLRLRNDIYFGQRCYGPSRPQGLDLTAYDQRARFFGLFCDGELVAGLRLVFREDTALAPVIRAMRAVVVNVVREARTRALPSEFSFDVVPTLGLRSELVDVEVGRFVVSRGTVGSRVVLKTMIAVLATLHLARVRYYFYSCAVTMAKRYAVVTKPRWQFEGAADSGIHADGFTYPTLSCGVVAAAEDSPFFGAALQYATELALTGSIVLSRPLPSTGAAFGLGNSHARVA